MKNTEFIPLAYEHKSLIYLWLAEQHMQEFWDNSQAHKDDIINFMGGRKTPSSYCGGKYFYWLSMMHGTPYAMIMTIQATENDPIDDIKLRHLSSTGHSYGLDFMIGNKDYLGKGYAPITLENFMIFFRENIDQRADKFLIDPEISNHKAIRAYQKAGFDMAGEFVMGGNVSGTGKEHYLLIKEF